MPKINVYLSDSLASAVKDAGVPVSAVCQAALTDAVGRVGRARQAAVLLRDESTSPSTFTRLAEGLLRRMTPRLVTALSLAGSSPDGSLSMNVSSLDLLRGLLVEEENFAVRLLAAQEIDVEVLRDGCAAGVADEAIAGSTEGADTLFARMTLPARAACATALEAVIEFGHNYVGCEHLLIGLLESDGSGAQLLMEQGARVDSMRQTLRGAVAGVAYERRAPTTDSDAYNDLARRIEVLERRLARDATE
jgi:ATP-dependent Clp protease ATP-binding subunit ClpC